MGTLAHATIEQKWSVSCSLYFAFLLNRDSHSITVDHYSKWINNSETRNIRMSQFEPASYQDSVLPSMICRITDKQVIIDEPLLVIWSTTQQLSRMYQDDHQGA